MCPRNEFQRWILFAAVIAGSLFVVYMVMSTLLFMTDGSVAFAAILGTGLVYAVVWYLELPKKPEIGGLVCREEESSREVSYDIINVDANRATSLAKHSDTGDHPSTATGATGYVQVDHCDYDELEQYVRQNAAPAPPSIGSEKIVNDLLKHQASDQIAALVEKGEVAGWLSKNDSRHKLTCRVNGCPAQSEDYCFNGQPVCNSCFKTFGEILSRKSAAEASKYLTNILKK